MLKPLAELAPTSPALATALATYRGAPPAQQVKWATAYANAALKPNAAVPASGLLSVPGSGPVPVMMQYELKAAQSGILDADLLAQHPFYGTDYTKPLLFVNDGGFYANKATAMHLTGGQWGVFRVHATGQPGLIALPDKPVSGAGGS